MEFVNIYAHTSDNSWESKQDNKHGSVKNFVISNAFKYYEGDGCLALLLAVCFALGTTPPTVFAAKGAERGETTAAPADNTETGIGVMIQEYSGSSTAEILMIQYNGQQQAFKNYNWKNPAIYWSTRLQFREIGT